MSIIKPVDIMALMEEKAVDDNRAYIDTEGDIVLTWGGYAYNITANRVKSHKYILGWVYHLTEKCWMNNRRIARFIELCGKVNGKDYTQCG